MTERNLLLVDDEPNIPRALKRLLRHDGYTILTANGGAEALQLLKEKSVGVIVSDHRMPAMTGIELLSKVRQIYPDITRIVLSGFSDLDTVTEAINQGNIYKFIAKPWDDTQLRTTIQEAFEHFELRMENHRLTEQLKVTNARLLQKNAETSGLVEQIVNHITDGIVVVNAERKVIFSNPSALSLLIENYRVLPGDEFKLPFTENQIIHQTLPRSGKKDLLIEVHSSTILHEGKQAFLISLHDLSDTKQLQNEKQSCEARIKNSCLQIAKAFNKYIEKEEPIIDDHQNKVSGLAVSIARDMELDANILEDITIAGLVHDIGTNHISAEIRNKPEPLSNDERLIVQEHPIIGYEIMSAVDAFKPIAEMILQHHEHIDGSGYPNGTTGEQMKLESKILAVANVVSAMSEQRAYRDAYSTDEILDYIKQESGKKFDPVVVKHCIKVLSTRSES